MVIHCPKCNYSRQPADTAPAGECPACGVIFEKLLAAPAPSKWNPAARIPTPTLTSASPDLAELVVAPEMTRCQACGRVVGGGADLCPNCGRPPLAVDWKPVTVGALVMLLAFWAMDAYQAPKPAPRPAIRQHAEICARDAGIDPGASQQITVEQRRDLDACLRRYGLDASKP